MKYFMGIDNGGTVTKAALYSNEGREIAVASAETQAIIPKPGFVERDMDAMWEANCKVIRDVLDKSKINPKDIAGIACCGHGKGLYLWGKDDKPVRNGIISSDNRAWEYAEKWKADGTEKKVFEKAYQHILACQPVSLLAWLIDHEPDILQKTKWVFECKDYVRFRLTGEAFAEITDYSGANLVNLKTRQYDTELLKLFGLEAIEPMLPPLRNSTDICGHITKEVSGLTGLAIGTPVAGGMFDIDACALAIDAASEDRICMIAGTWSINEYISKDPVVDGSILMNSIFCLPEYYLIEECSATSAGNNEWFIQTLLPELKEEAKRKNESIYDIINHLVESIPAGEFCPIFLPFLMASNVHPNAKASFVGLSSYHTRAHIMRSIYEGIAFSHRYHLDKLLHARKVPVSCIRLAGGVARSKVWTQMFADIMKYPIQTVNVRETGALGCAIAAAVAVGEYKSFSEASNKMLSISEPVVPNPANIAIYEKKYEIYKKTIKALDPLWDTVQDFIEDNGGNN